MTLRLARFNGLALTPLRWPARHDPRHLAWRPNGRQALVVGNAGTLVLVDDTPSVVATPSREPLRGVAWHPSGEYALVVGDNGALVVFDGTSRSTPLLTPVHLRRASFHPSGRYCLIVGNDGLVVRWQEGRTRGVGWGHRHLRGLAWRPDGALALIAANGGLYRYQDGADDIELLGDLPDGDLVSCDWSLDGAQARVAGYVQRPDEPDTRRPVIWTVVDDGSIVDQVEHEPGHVFVSVSHRADSEWWIVDQPIRSGVTRLAQVRDGMSGGGIERTDTRFVQLAWHPGGDEALVIASPRAAYWRA